MASSLETNKLIAAVLTAGVIASGSGVVSRILYGVETPEETAYQIAVAEDGGVGAGGDEGGQPLGVLLASADAAAGEGDSRACAACHSFEEGGANKIGPALHGVVGRDIAAVDGFAYSDALAGMDGAWDYAALDGFLADPKGWAPGTKMSYAGIRSDEDRADMILYLRSVSPDAPPLPEPEETAAAEAGSEGGEGAGGEAAGGGVIAMIADADPAAGESASKKCAACHSFDEGGPNKIGPNLHGVVGREIAAVDGFAYSDALAGKDGAWDYAALDGYLADPKGWAPGTKMSFAGVKKEQERAELLAYLRSISPDAPPLPEGGGDQAGGGAGDGGEQQAAGEGEGDQQGQSEETSDQQQAAADGAGDQEQGEEGQQQAAAEAGDGGEGAADEAAGGGVIAMIADADPAAGESASRVCVACHSFEEGGPNKIGPALYGIVGRDIAAVEDFSYSDALAGMDGTWDYAALDGFLANPREWAPGTKMAYAGVKKEEQRAAMIAYLRSLSPDAPPLPGAEDKAETEGGGSDRQQAANDGAGTENGRDQGAAGVQEVAADPGRLNDGRPAAADGTQPGTGGQGSNADEASVVRQTAQANPPGRIGEARLEDSSAAAASPSAAALEARAAALKEALSDQPAADQQVAVSGESGSSSPSDRQQRSAEGEDASSVTAGEQQQAAVSEDPSSGGEADQADDGAAEGALAMIAAADPAAGEKAARKCVACHSFDEGGPAKIGPNLYGIVGRDIAAADGFRYSGALQGKEGSWDYAALDAFLENPRGWAKGTRMTFAGVRKDQERAEILAYLGSISPDAPPPPGQ